MIDVVSLVENLYENGNHTLSCDIWMVVCLGLRSP